MPVNTETVAKVMSGLPTGEEMLTGIDGDNLNAVIQDPNTNTEEPATLRE